MASPRIQLGVYPLYPGSATANLFAVPTCQVTQVKVQLASMVSGSVNRYDAVEASLGGPTSPATISWASGGTIVVGSPLSNVIANVLGYDSIAMAAFLTACSSIVI